jgi:RHS repeat-associated protein
LYALGASRYTGKERDTESGLDYFGARYYGSTMGRWMSPDPTMLGAILELPQTWNIYSYEYNRPTYGTDPDGRCPPCVGAIVGGVVEAGINFGSQLHSNGGDVSKVNGIKWVLMPQAVLSQEQSRERQVALAC